MIPDGIDCLALTPHPFFCVMNLSSPGAYCRFCSRWFEHRSFCGHISLSHSVNRDLQKNKVDYWTDEGKKNTVRIRKDGVRQVKIQDPDGHWIEINEAY